jgi:hypothetical protein
LVVDRWRLWLLVAFAAVAVTCFLPGSMLSHPTAAARSAAIEASELASSGNGCAVVSCERGGPTVSVPLATVTVAGVLGAGMVTLSLTRTRRRFRDLSLPLPSGSPLRLLRPPQASLPA